MFPQQSPSHVSDWVLNTPLLNLFENIGTGEYNRLNNRLKE